MPLYYKKSVIFERGESFFFSEEQTLYGSARLGTEQVEHSMRGLVTKDGLMDAITRAREQHGDDWQQRLQEQYEGNFYERLQEAWGNEWNTRLDLVLQGNNDAWLIEQIRNESYTFQIGNKRYELSNHLGNVQAVVSDKKEQSDGVTWSAIVLSATDYFPFGMAMPGRSTDAKHRYGFNGKETDPETGLNDFGARLYDNRLGRWLAVDPLAKKYSFLSPYNFVSNCPLLLIDPNGEDIRYYDINGNEIQSKRITSTTDFKVFVQRQTTTPDGKSILGDVEAPMPKIMKIIQWKEIKDKKTGKVIRREKQWAEGSEYQQHDYLIAAMTKLFNIKLEEAKDPTDILSNPENPNIKLSGEFPKQIDVNLVKAIVLQESEAGNGTGDDTDTDITQVNADVDWGTTAALKKAVGLTQNVNSPYISLKAFFPYLFFKGFKGGTVETIVTDKKKGTETYKLFWKGDTNSWYEAVKRYNGTGKKAETYRAEVYEQLGTSQKPESTDYPKN